MISSGSLKGFLGNLSHFALNTIVLPGNCTVFTFHRVLSEESYAKTSFQKSIAISDVALRHFILGLKNRFEIISLQRLVDIQKGEADYSNRTAYACITFDDGWYDNYQYAFPILKEFDVPATIFLSTDYIDTDEGFWWQNLGDVLSNEDLSDSQKNALKRLITPFVGELALEVEAGSVDDIIATIKDKCYESALEITHKALEIAGQKLTPHGLTWSNCEVMSEHGISFGSHTLSHPRLSLLGSSSLVEELSLSKSNIENRGVNYVNAICYPYGDVSREVLNAAREYYDVGFTTALGLGVINKDDAVLDSEIAMPRINVSNSMALNIGRLNYRLIRAAISRRR